MLSGLSKTRNAVYNKLTRTAISNSEREPDVDFSISLSDNLRLADPGTEPICTTCKYMIDDILDIRTSKIKNNNNITTHAPTHPPTKSPSHHIKSIISF